LYITSEEKHRLKDLAVWNGNFECFICLNVYITTRDILDDENEEYNNYIINTAAEYGHLKFLEWVTKLPEYHIDYHAINLAAIGGHLSCLKYLIEKQNVKGQLVVTE